MGKSALYLMIPREDIPKVENRQLIDGSGRQLVSYSDGSSLCFTDRDVHEARIQALRFLALAEHEERQERDAKAADRLREAQRLQARRDEIAASGHGSGFSPTYAQCNGFERYLIDKMIDLTDQMAATDR